MDKFLFSIDQTALGQNMRQKLGLMRGPWFDSLFIFVPLALCFIAYHFLFSHSFMAAGGLGTVILIYSAYFSTGHAMSTFSRVIWNKESFKKYHWLLIATPAAIAVILYFVVNTYGVAFLMTTYFVLQWFHYVRQGYGLSQVYRRSHNVTDPEWLHQSVIYLIPLGGLLYRMTTPDLKFLFSPLYTVPELSLLVMPVMGLGVTMFIVWLFRRALDIYNGKPVVGYTLFVLTHILVFYLAFVHINDATIGWIGSAFWHATQYLFFVWHFNKRQAESAGGYTNWFQWVAVSMFIFIPGFLFFGDFMTSGWAWLQGELQLAAATAVALNLAFLYNHYLADAILWRRQKKTYQAKT